MPSKAYQARQLFCTPDHVQVDVMCYGQETLSLESLYINPEHRGQGLGRETMHRLTKACDQLGVALELEVGHDEAEIGLIQWYTRLGFRHCQGYWRREAKD